MNLNCTILKKKIDIENGKYVSDVHVVIFKRFRLQPLNILDKIQVLTCV